MTCVDVGSSNPDIGGIGIVIAFALQALVSIVISTGSFACSSKLSKIGFQDHKRYNEVRKIREIADGILLFASDAQTLNGIALLISGLSQVKTLDLYHLHIVYDTVTFTSISNCAAIICSFRTLKDHRVNRFISISIFVILYLAYTIGFGVRLNLWDENKSGHCYNTRYISDPSSKHPYVDKIYLGITCFFLIGVLEWAFIGAFNINMGLAPPLFVRRRSQFNDQGDVTEMYLGSAMLVLCYASLQFPLHLYSVIALKAANQPFLQGDSENMWGFGQVVAMVMFGATLTECCKGVKEWYMWKHHSDE